MRGGIEDGAGGGGRVRRISNTRWQREDLEAMLPNKTWGSGERTGEGVRAELLAQKAIYESASQSWRHPWARLAAVFSTTWGEWRRKLWRH